MYAITTKNLTKKFGDNVAVKDLNLDIKQGEIFGLLGPNGAGKTTTLMMLSTLLRPTSGTARVNDFDILTHPASVRESIGMVFQDPSSDDILTAYENLKLHALMYNLRMDTIDEKIDKVLSLVDLLDRKDDLVREYSGGMRRRMEIARGLLHEPKILFLDEPTLGLDPQTREHIWEYIESLARNNAMTIILTTHYMEEADKLCDRIAIIDGGEIVTLNSPENLKDSVGSDMVVLKGSSLNIEGIKKLPFVKSIEEEHNFIKVYLEDSSANLSILLKNAGEVNFVETHTPDLNDVFLYYTGREIREEGAGSMDKMRYSLRARSKR